jgi:hypothetical protein
MTSQSRKKPYASLDTSPAILRPIFSLFIFFAALKPHADKVDATD